MTAQTEQIQNHYTFEIENLEEKKQIAKEIHEAKNKLNELLLKGAELGLRVAVHGDYFFDRKPEVRVYTSIEVGKRIDLNP